MKIRKLLRAFERGEVDASAVLADVEWSKVAESVRKRWSLPGDVELSDIEQEMRIGAWQALADYQAGRSTFENFVMFRAHATARRFINKTRGTPGSVKGDELKLGRFFRNMSDLTAARAAVTGDFSADESSADDWPAPEPEHDDSRARENIMRRLSRCDAVTQTAVLAFIDEGDSEKAARVLFLSRSFRRQARVKSEAETQEFILASARLVACQP